MGKNDDLILYIYRKKDDCYFWEIKEIGPMPPQTAKFLPAWGKFFACGTAASYDAASKAGHAALKRINKKQRKNK